MKLLWRDTEPGHTRGTVTQARERSGAVDSSKETLRSSPLRIVPLSKGRFWQIVRL